uniref:EGF-like domain-containing protein n=2 Tax=Callorhinchus milii TaxID=7868 RepID=A0A4W3HMZ6_CALMI
MVNAGNCDENAFCVNTLGSYVCVCQNGYFRDGMKCQGSSIWTPWSPWSVCTVSCGVQNTMRVRLCTHPESGMRCEGPSVQLKHCDSVSPCPVLGKWSEWSPWSTCTQLCSGITRRIRVCNNPAPAHGGLPCTGTFEENLACRHSDCPTDGGWSPWTFWSPCPSSCGIGVVKRSRLCNNPAPENSGNPCLGHDYEEGSCGFPLDYCKYLTRPMDAVVKGRWI